MIRLLLPALAALLFFGSAMTGRGQLLITEFLASNQAGFTDEDGDTSDWIEICNAGLLTVDLEGCHLTDDAALPLKWTFPSRLLAPGSYLLVFASGKDRTVAQLHTSFSLLASGEYLALTDPSGTVLHAVGSPFPAQSADISYGLIEPAAGSQAGFFQTPTPAAPNFTGTVLLPAPTFSEPARTFTAPLTVSVLPPAAGYQIRYTLDGTLPAAGSALYDSPLSISQTTRLRARLFQGTQAAGQPGGATYIHLAGGAETFTSNLPLMILDNFNGNRPTNGTLAEWMIFTPDAATSRASLASLPSLRSRSFIKVRGSSTANDPKYSLGLETRNEQDGDARVSPLGMPSESDWILQAPYSYDRSLIRNALAYQLSNDMGRYAARTRQVELFLNTDGGSLTSADYFGVFTFMEKITRSEDRVDIEKLRPIDAAAPGIEGGYLLKIDRPDPGDVGFVAGSGQRYYFVDPKEQEITVAQRNWITGHFNSMWTALSGPEFSNPTGGYASYFHLDATADHHVLNVALKNLDALRLSTYIHKDRWGKLAWGPVWDFDRSMESTDGRDDNFNTWRGETGDQGTDFFRHPMWLELFRDANFWQRWIDRYGLIRTGPLATAHVHAVIDTMTAELGEAQVRNFSKWPAVPPRISWQWEIQHLKDWLASRLAWMDQQFTRPATSNAPLPNGGLVPAGFPLTLTSASLARPGVKIYYTTDGSDPRPAESNHFDLTLVPLNSPIRALLPTADPGPAWHGSSLSPDPFDDAGWISGNSGIGYDDQPDYDSYIGVNFESPNPVMKSVTGSAYLRARFTLTAAQLASIHRMELRMRYDDGFAAHLNGVEIASANAPAPLAWNALAATGRPDSDAVVQAPFDVSQFVSALHEGENVLAVHGLNYPANSTDFLCQPELLAGTSPPVAATAMEYTGPVPITGTTNLFARVYDPAGPFAPYPYTGAGSGQTPAGSHWSAPLRLSLFTDAVPASAANLVISEIMYHPRPASAAELAAGWDTDDFDYLVLKNIGLHPVNLAGVHFAAGVMFSAPLDSLSYLPAGGSVVLAAKPDAFRLRYPGCILPLLGGYQGNLGNEGDHLTLLDAGGGLIKDFAYGDLPPWPAQADGCGFSLLLRHPAANPPHGEAASWRASLDPGGELPGTLPSDFGAWRSRHFDPASPAYDMLSAPAADPDNDGLDNFLEFAMGTSPAEGSPAPLRFRPQGAMLLVEYDRRPGLGGVTFEAQASSTATGGWLPAGSPAGPPVPNANGTETVTLIPNPPAADRRFFRVRASQP